MKKSEWQSFLSIKLKALNNLYDFRKKYEPIIFVENKKSDGKVYHNLIKSHKDKNIDVNFDKNIYDLCDVVFSFNENNDGTLAINKNYGCYYSNHYSNKQRKNNHILVCDAIIDAVEFCSKDKDISSRFDVYGFIDKDTNGHNRTTGKQISLTKMHDCETNVLRYCLNKYIDRLAKKEEVKKGIKKILSFAFYQGILEKTSFELDKNSPIKGAIANITHSSFMSGELYGLFNKYYNHSFPFIDYLEDKKIYKYGKEYNDFKNAYSNNIKKIVDFDFNHLIDKWLNLTHFGIDDERLDLIFGLTNGHIILSLLIDLVGGYLEVENLMLSSKKEKPTKIILKMLECADENTIVELNKINPTNEYINHYFMRFQNS